MSNSRAEILGKIRRALVKPRPAHHHGHSPATSDLSKLFASVASREGLVEKFQKEFELVSGEFSFCDNSAAVIQLLTQLIQSSASSKVAISGHAICKCLGIAETLQAQLQDVSFLVEDIKSENSFDRTRLRNSMAQVQLSITGAEYLIAESGTIVTVAGPQASRQISLLPSIHVVLATPGQLFPNMADLFLEIQRTHGTMLPGSALTCITGPSRRHRESPDQGRPRTNPITHDHGWSLSRRSSHLALCGTRGCLKLTKSRFSASCQASGPVSRFHQTANNALCDEFAFFYSS